VHVRCATRKLAAILVSDVVGYRRLAGTDEDRILARLRGVRSDLIDPARVVKRTLWLKRHGLNISCGPRKLGRRMP
jgi:adenylate cyclase